MSRPICSRCARRRHCRLRQPGTWATDCDRYVEDPTLAGAESQARGKTADASPSPGVAKGRPRRPRRSQA